MKRPRLQALPLALLGVLGFASSGVADNVYLKNGSVFEGVVATVSADGVVIRLAIGTIKVSSEQVSRIEQLETPLDRFEARRAELREDPAADLASWLELARSARVHGLDFQHRETLLLVADLAPRFGGLAAMMEGIGYRFDADRGWERVEVSSRLSQAAGPSQATAPEPEPPPSERVSDNEVALASIELASQAISASAGSRVPAVQRFPYAGQLLGIAFVRHPRSSTVNDPSGWAALATRQPGSLIPLREFRRFVE